MNLTTPSKNVARRSGRASRPTQRFSSPGYVVERPQHRSAAPVDATTYSVGFLKRQDARQQPWFRDLDFVKVAEADIKAIFWTDTMEGKFSEYIPIPLAGSPTRSWTRSWTGSHLRKNKFRTCKLFTIVYYYSLTSVHNFLEHSISSFTSSKQHTSSSCSACSATSSTGFFSEFFFFFRFLLSTV